jgi:medium-chain acyl-[acyl-carrier-protein] hydrolase
MVTQMPARTWFPYLKARPQARMRLFCFPYAGGGAALYRNWSERLPVAVEILPVQLPGRENRISEQPYTDLQKLVAELSVVIQPYLDKPFAFFGYSMGALISYELACHLRSQHQPMPCHLFLAASRAAHLPNLKPWLHELPREQLIQNLKRLGGTAGELLENTEVLDVLLPLFRADFALCETYTYLPKPPLKASISIFGGKDDTTVSLQEVSAWQEQTQGVCMRHHFAGQHFFLHTEEEQILAVVEQTLQWILQQK